MRTRGSADSVQPEIVEEIRGFWQKKHRVELLKKDPNEALNEFFEEWNCWANQRGDHEAWGRMRPSHRSNCHRATSVVRTVPWTEKGWKVDVGWAGENLHDLVNQRRCSSWKWQFCTSLVYSWKYINQVHHISLYSHLRNECKRTSNFCGAAEHQLRPGDATSGREGASDRGLMWLSMPRWSTHVKTGHFLDNPVLSMLNIHIIKNDSWTTLSNTNIIKITNMIKNDYYLELLLCWLGDGGWTIFEGQGRWVWSKGGSVFLQLSTWCQKCLKTPGLVLIHTVTNFWNMFSNVWVLTCHPRGSGWWAASAPGTGWPARSHRRFRRWCWVPICGGLEVKIWLLFKYIIKYHWIISRKIYAQIFYDDFCRSKSLSLKRSFC